MILLVEDNDNDASLTKRILRKQAPKTKEVAAAYHHGTNSFRRKTGQCRQFEDTVRLTAPHWLNLNHPCRRCATAGVLWR